MKYYCRKKFGLLPGQINSKNNNETQHILKVDIESVCYSCDSHIHIHMRWTNEQMNECKSVWMCMCVCVFQLNMKILWFSSAHSFESICFQVLHFLFYTNSNEWMNEYSYFAFPGNNLNFTFIYTHIHIHISIMFIFCNLH